MVVFTWSRGMVSSLFEEVQSAEEEYCEIVKFETLSYAWHALLRQL